MNPTGANPNFPTFVVYDERGSIYLSMRLIRDQSPGIMHKGAEKIVSGTVGQIHG